MTEFSVRHATLQAPGWWLIQHDDEHDGSTPDPVAAWGLLSLELSEGGGDGGSPPAASRHRAKMERGHLGLLFIYFLPYAVSSAMLQ